MTSIAQDLKFVSDVLASVTAGYCVDSDRVYATGYGCFYTLSSRPGPTDCR